MMRLRWLPGVFDPTGDSRQEGGSAVTRIFSDDDGGFQTTVDLLIENGTEHNNDKPRNQIIGHEDGLYAHFDDVFGQGLGEGRPCRPGRPSLSRIVMNQEWQSSWRVYIGSQGISNERTVYDT